ncbi:hypothetical protein NKH24_30380 [Mesorhizobium sp. M1300]|uniref:hypothetical protein n=1 Tax=Mesorhizobium sp. M1300 TaxID=2957077 RepID=UPI003336C816
MATFAPLWRSDPIQYLLNWKFPQLVAFGGKNTLASVMSLDSVTLSAIAYDAQAYRQELLNQSPDELTALLEIAKADDARRYKEFREREESQRSFNQPGASADFDYWAKMSTWSIDEAISLSFGKNPKCINWKHIQSIENISPFAAEYAAKRELATRAIAMGQLWESTIPAGFLAWAERMRVSVPAELVAAVKGLGIQIADWKTLYEQAIEVAESAQASVTEKHSALMSAMADHSQSISKLSKDYSGLLAQRDQLIRLKADRIESLTARLAEMETTQSAAREKSLGARERESLLKLVIGMAIKGYSFDPKNGRTTTAKEISGDLALIGMAMDEDTVRKYLAEAKQLLPGDQTDRDR